MVVRAFIPFLLLGQLSGCATSFRFIDVTERELSPSVVSVEAKESSITLHIKHDTGLAYLSSVGVRVLDGDVYLDPAYISTAHGTTVFTVELSAAGIPQDWRSRLYWIEQELIPSPLNPFAERVREIRRRRVVL